MHFNLFMWSFLQLVLAAFSAIALFAIVAELAARLYLRGIRPYAYVPGSRLTMTLHPEACPALPRRIVSYDVNSYGERGPEPPPGKDIFRVLVAGGSAVECRLLSQQYNWGLRLKSHLILPKMNSVTGGRPVHVGVVAKSQMDSTALHYMLRNILPKYPKLDILFIMIGFSDALRWTEDGAEPNRLPPPMPPDELLVNFPTMKFPWPRPALYELAARLNRQFRREYLNVGYGIVRETKARASVTEFIPLAQDREQVHALYRRNLEQLVELGRRHSRRVILVPQPWFDKNECSPEEQTCLWGGRIGHPKAPGPAKFLSYPDLCEMFRSIEQVMVETAQATGTEYIDVQSELPPRLGVFYDHAHVGEEGADIIAQKIASDLLRKPVV